MNIQTNIAEGSPPSFLAALSSPVLFRGDGATAYRDPAAVWHDGWFYLYFSLIKTEADGQSYGYTAWSKSRELAAWTAPRIFTPRDRNLNFSSPGSVIKAGNDWVLCLQTYPRPHGEKYGNENSRIWTMRSRNLEDWAAPRLLRVEGPDVPADKMSRMIDPYLVEDKTEPGKWWCLYKYNGVSASWSHDLETWTPAGSCPDAGENACVVVDGDEYVLFHSPEMGIGVRRSTDMKTWRDLGVLTLGLDQWPWAKGRLTAGFVLDARKVPGVERYVMFFHGSDYPEADERGGFDTYSSLAVAWSSDLTCWDWPRESTFEPNP
jgi:hypothetical protein